MPTLAVPLRTSPPGTTAKISRAWSAAGFKASRSAWLVFSVDPLFAALTCARAGVEYTKFLQAFLSRQALDPVAFFPRQFVEVLPQFRFAYVFQLGIRQLSQQQRPALLR